MCPATSYPDSRSTGNVRGKGSSVAVVVQSVKNCPARSYQDSRNEEEARTEAAWMCLVPGEDCA